MSSAPELDGIAIVGIALRLPGANSAAEFWNNLRNGVHSIRFFSHEELAAAGVDPGQLNHPHYVRASPVIDGFDRFDAAFFNFSPKEAAIMDPQNRLFLEICWQALEDAGFDPERTGDSVVGVFAGAGSALTSYMLAYSGHPDMQGQTAGLQHINADRDFLSTRVSYKLNLTGPSLTVQTACSTSLVAVHLACQSLMNRECDMAIAGASTVRVPHISGYLAEPDSVHSSDGHCRAFDAAGRGTIFGSGVAAVVLKPLAQAIEERHHIYAVIKGSAINNDGAAKISYTAASVQGQARAMVEALEVAGVSADTIQYVECHATGTRAGDPIEIQALTRAFRAHTQRQRYCAVGSVKTNIGHPEQSAGLAGLIKTALALKHRELPPTLHFATPNPNIPFENSPFFVQDTRAEWTGNGGAPRRAAVNSLGIGGTNAFVILEEAPAQSEQPDTDRTPSGLQICCLSAKSDAALRRRAGQFLSVLEATDAPALGDLCHTANVSRSRLPYRAAAIGSTREELRGDLASVLEGDLAPMNAAGASGPIAFLFSGQGAQYAGMSAGLYGAVPVFRDALDEGDALLRPVLGESLHAILRDEASTMRLSDTIMLQPALFAVEYSIARAWQSWGVQPSAVLGHSVGELAAACVAGVFDLASAITLVARRGELMQSTTAGAMLACAAGEPVVEKALRAFAGALTIAAVNSPSNTVVSGNASAIGELRSMLERDGIRTKPLTVSHAFHSALLDPILPALEEAAARLTARAPQLTFISNVTGKPMVDCPAPSYWREQARSPVRFADGIRTLYELGCRVFLEVGPGGSCITAGREVIPEAQARWLPSLSKNRDEHRTMLESLRTLYLDGASIDWKQVHNDRRRSLVSLPLYPFEPTRHWLDSGPASAPLRRPAPAVDQLDSEPQSKAAPWHHVTWTPLAETAAPDAARTAMSNQWLLVADSGGFSDQVATVLKSRGQRVTIIRSTRAPMTPSRLLKNVDAISNGETRVLDLRGLDCPSATGLSAPALERAERTIARTALPLVRTLASQPASRQTRIWIVTRGAMRIVAEDASVEPVPAMLWGFGRSAAIETPAVWGGLIDLEPGADRQDLAEASSLVDAILRSDSESQIGIRRGRHFVPRLDRFAGESGAANAIPVKADATYLITGGTGMLGLTMARWLVERRGARHVVLASRRGDASAASDSIAALEAAGARIAIVAADVSRPADIRRVLQRIDREMPALAGVVHCAGVLTDGILGQMDEPAFTSVTAPKVRGAWVLHEQTKSLPLDFFLLHSSLLSLTGSAGQANYTAANAFLDSLVDFRRAQGLPAMAVNWGPWAGSGMAASAGARGESMWRQRGVTLIDAETGFGALDALFDHPVDHAAVAICDWRRYVDHLPVRSRFLDALAAAIPRASSDNAGDLQQRLSTAPPEDRRRLLLDVLRQQLGKELGFAGDLDIRQPLEQLGVDSLMSVNLANRLETSLGVRVPVIKLMKSPSLEGLADDLLSELTLAGSASAPIGASEPSAAKATTGAGPAIAETRGRGWLVFPKPNPAAAFRLLCFNYAGGGAGIYRPWADLLSPSVELIAIEPPGRGARIDEKPFVRIEKLIDALMPELAPYLDRPTAVFGHCLGGLTMFETTRRALAEGADIAHVFVSGCRPPHALDTLGPFEDDLLSKLLPDRDFDPLAPFHAQPDQIFARVIQQFDIGVTDEFLARPELRALLLPCIRADFELAYRYRRTPEPPWDVPISCFVGLGDAYVTRDDALGWNRYSRREFRLHYRPGTHFLVSEDRAFIVAAINEALSARRVGTARSRTDQPITS